MALEIPRVGGELVVRGGRGLGLTQLYHGLRQVLRESECKSDYKTVGSIPWRGRVGDGVSVRPPFPESTLVQTCLRLVPKSTECYRDVNLILYLACA